MSLLNSTHLFALPIVVLLATAANAVDADTDGDGLSDFHERHKYFTDPTNRDSDGDGLPDEAWDERREYSYTVRSVVRVMRPVDDSALLDDYQDARVLEETPTWVKLEVIHYPLNTVAEAIKADAKWQTNARSMKAYVTPGLTSNWDEAMRTALLKELGEARIKVDELDDRALVERASKWLLDRAKYDRGQFTGYFTDFLEGRPVVCPGCEKGLENYNRAGRSIKDQWAHDLLAKGMFENRTRGSCTSTAIYMNAGLRAIGIPTRIVYCIPVIDASDPSEVAMLAGLRHPKISRVLKQALGSIGDSWSGHTFNEVYVGGRWRRLNYAILGQNTFGPNVFGLMTHVFTVNDWSEANVARTIGVRQSKGTTDDVFGHRNPYSTVELSDRFGIHASIDMAAESADGWKTLTIERAIWYFSAERPNDITLRIDDPSHAGYVLLKVRENRSDEGLAQYQPFWDAVDKDFVLKAEGQDDLEAKATRGYWGSGWFFLEVPRAEYDRMVKEVPYELVPANAKGERRWAVAEGVRLVRMDKPQPRKPVSSPAPAIGARTLDELIWSDGPECRRRLGDGMQGLLKRLNVVAHVEGYDGDFQALKRHQAASGSIFQLEAKGHPPLRARMGSGGITIGSGEAWVLLAVEGKPLEGVTYTLRTPDPKWVIRVALPAR